MQILDRLRESLGPLRNPFSNSLLTLSVESGSIRLMTSEKGRVASWLNMPFNPRLVSDGQIQDPEAMSTVIRNAVGRLGVRGTTLVSAFPSPRVTSRVMNFPSVGAVRPNTIIPREARRVMGSAVDCHDLFWTSLGKVGLQQRYYLLAAPKGELVTFLQTLALSGFKPRSVDARFLALTRGVGVTPSLILSVESLGFDVLVVVGYIPLVVFHRELQMGLGADDLTAEIVDEVQGAIEYHTDRYPAAVLPPNAPVYFTRGHPLVTVDFAQTLGNSLTREVRFPNPAIEYPEDFPVPQYMVNVGLALKHR